METQQAAQQLGLSGWVKNRSNGTVEAVFEGDQGSVDQMLRWCRQGPPLSKVNHVDIHWEPYGDTSEGFKITY